MEDRKLNKDVHYYVLMNPSKTSYNKGNNYYNVVDRGNLAKWVECEILVLNQIELIPLEEGYSRKRISHFDFLYCIRNGYIVEKVPNLECVREEWEEPLTDTVNLHHSAYVLKIKEN